MTKGFSHLNEPEELMRFLSMVHSYYYESTSSKQVTPLDLKHKETWSKIMTMVVLLFLYFIS